MLLAPNDMNENEKEEAKGINTKRIGLNRVDVFFIYLILILFDQQLQSAAQNLYTMNISSNNKYAKCRWLHNDNDILTKHTVTGVIKFYIHKKGHCNRTKNRYQLRVRHFHFLWKNTSGPLFKCSRTAAVIIFRRC